MSVYTHLSDDEFFAFCGLFGVKFKKAIPITQGIKNSNWFIQTDSDVGDEFSYVFTLFEERVPADIIKMATVMHALKDKLPIAPPLVKLTAKGDDIGTDCVMRYENKAILVVPKLSGSHPKTTDEPMCFEMGKALATLHNTLQTLEPAENYGVPLYDWTRVKERETAYMPTDEARLMNDIWEAYANLPADLPKGLCHLDMFTDNTLWDFAGDTATLTGLLDFTEVSVEHYLMDIAITINDFCTTWGNARDGESVNFNTDKMSAFIDGYESVRPLTANEKTALPVMLAYSATIFWLLRLNVIYYNREQGRTGDDIMVKNPDLMKRLASFHWRRV
ncbi:homoserine kinase [Moraxella bovis]|uniref:Homoserine kinase n=1 Tax=Moraxella bovis TaxID=476 RepID=A0A378PQW1_MORBO|nr:homoserine kinase [Moraxella bovis]UYZ76008.1 homoserine kinase [Moraxella bovis]UYZ78039.1 homoserine kinase [Moraxella bovis]UYZ86525.1 homoserine kinase [Moraxella bovis]UYZ89772.1 homoserine kinase [Moraxella bovis]UYZ91958.1 homoserine kinase [Moraxella bovis]